MSREQGTPPTTILFVSRCYPARSAPGRQPSTVPAARTAQGSPARMPSSTRDTSRQCAPVHLRYGCTPNPRPGPGPTAAPASWDRRGPRWRARSPRQGDPAGASSRTAGSADASSQPTAAPVVSSIVLIPRSCDTRPGAERRGWACAAISKNAVTPHASRRQLQSVTRLLTRRDADRRFGTADSLSVSRMLETQIALFCAALCGYRLPGACP